MIRFSIDFPIFKLLSEILEYLVLLKFFNINIIDLSDDTYNIFDVYIWYTYTRYYFLKHDVSSRV